MSADEQNKSEQATAYKLEQARKKGMVPRSPDAGVVLGLAGFGGYLWARGDQLAAQLAALDARTLHDAAYLAVNGQAVLTLGASFATQTARLIAPLVGVSAGAAVLGTVMQTGLLFAPDALKADMSRLNPAQGFKRIFSMQTLIEAAKACIKMLVYGVIIWRFIVSIVTTSVHTPLSASALCVALLRQCLSLGVALLCTAVIFALIDQVIVRRAFAKKMRMSRHEIRQEHKQREGDPRIRQRRRQLQRELLQRSASMRNIRQADVLVTNPTHFAVALKYDSATMAAPKLIARGAGDFALRLKRLAFVYSVPVIESKMLARQLYHDAPFEREIPTHLFRDAAAVYLRAKRAPSQRGEA